MFARLALLFVVVPLLELVLLVRLGQLMGLWPTLALVVVTGLVGAALARAQGVRALARVQGEMAAGRMPGQSLLDGLAILVGGAFLLTPGLLTDVAGFLLLLPPTRRWIQRRMRASLEQRVARGDLRVFVLDGSGGSPFAPPERSEADEDRLDPRYEVGPRN